jgi:hypothetical protein
MRLRADAVRHVSVNAVPRTAHRTDSHGHRPHNRLACDCRATLAMIIYQVEAAHDHERRH